MKKLKELVLDEYTLYTAIKKEISLQPDEYCKVYDSIKRLYQKNGYFPQEAILCAYEHTQKLYNEVEHEKAIKDY